MGTLQKKKDTSMRRPLTTIIFTMLMLVFKPMLMQDSMLYVVNGLLMLVSFFFCRVMLFPYLYYWYSSHINETLMATLLSIPLWVHLAVIGLWSPQLIWFHRMLKGSLKRSKMPKKEAIRKWSASVKR